MSRGVERPNWFAIIAGLIHGRSRTPPDKIPFLTDFEINLARDHEVEKEADKGGPGYAKGFQGMLAAAVQAEEVAKLNQLERLYRVMEQWG